MNCKIYAKTELNPTEDIDKVTKTLKNMFDYDDIEIGEDYVLVSGEKESITNLRKEMRERKIRGAARKIMLKGIGANKIYFKLSKQAAFVGVPNFVEDDLSPLGEIDVEIETDDVQRFIDWIAPEINSV
ncbi:RNA-binding domain-containing protein [Methanobacterium sp. MBAC-LM]|uniref:RNA-binding domain-containing protein n=1 Tax=Methanobacterium sp. MBAC-LM TaxID=3412034 RepID=UPI003C746571